MKNTVRLEMHVWYAQCTCALNTVQLNQMKICNNVQILTRTHRYAVFLYLIQNLNYVVVFSYYIEDNNFQKWFYINVK